MSQDLTPIGKQIEDRQREEESRKQQAEIEKKEAQDAWKSLDKLLSMPEFAWYLDHVLRPMVYEELGKAIDISKDKEARDNAAHRHDFGQEILKAAQLRRAFFAKVGDIDQ